MPLYQADLASTWANHGAALIAGRHVDQAIAACQEAINILNVLVGEYPAVNDYQSRLAETYTTLGHVQSVIGRTAEAEALFRHATTIRAKSEQKRESVDD